MLGVIGLAIGIGLGFVFPGYFPETLSDYMGIMLIACADSIIGGLRAVRSGSITTASLSRDFSSTHFWRLR